MDQEILDNYVVEDITEKTIGEDFRRDMKIHHCFLIRNKIKIKIKSNRKPREKR